MAYVNRYGEPAVEPNSIVTIVNCCASIMSNGDRRYSRPELTYRKGDEWVEIQCAQARAIIDDELDNA